MSDIVVNRVDYNDPAQGADLLAMLEIYAHDPMGGGGTLNGDVRARLLTDLAARPFALSWLAYRDGAAVGLANAFLGYSTFAARSLINIHDVVTHPDHRGCGVATALFAEIERTAQVEGCCKITLEVLDGNTRAKALYAHLGYGGYGLGEGQGTAEFWQKAMT